MSIFEPITSVDRSVDPESSPEARAESDHPARGRSIAPRSIQIAGLVSVGLVLLGLIATNAARPEPEQRPALTSRVEPGAAAVENVDLAPNPQPSVAPAQEPADVVDNAESDESDDGWEDSWDEVRDKVGKGHGNGNAHGHKR